MASSSWVEKACNDVLFNDVPAALYERLGDQGTIALLEVLESSEHEGSANVLVAASDRFERRLVQELAALRVHMTGLARDLRQELATNRVEWLKWSFVFSIGQLAGVGGLMALLLRLGR